MKEELEAESFDETIRMMILKMKKPKKSMFGTLKNVKVTFEREKHDRFD